MQYEKFHTMLSPKLRDFVSRETFLRLNIYVAHLLKWNKAINLISPSTEEEIWHRHIMDSLQLATYIPSSHRILDLGSGGGLPGMVMACLNYRVTLVESDQRKVIFLREALRLCGSEHATIVESRIEQLSIQTADTITARALAPLEQLCKYVYPHLGITTQCLFPKGARYSNELAQAKQKWHFEFAAHPSVSDSNAVILQLSHLSPV